MVELECVRMHNLACRESSIKGKGIFPLNYDLKCLY